MTAQVRDGDCRSVLDVARTLAHLASATVPVLAALLPLALRAESLAMLFCMCAWVVIWFGFVRVVGNCSRGYLAEQPARRKAIAAFGGALLIFFVLLGARQSHVFRTAVLKVGGKANNLQHSGSTSAFAANATAANASLVQVTDSAVVAACKTTNVLWSRSFGASFREWWAKWTPVAASAAVGAAITAPACLGAMWVATKPGFREKDWALLLDGATYAGMAVFLATLAGTHEVQSHMPLQAQGFLELIEPLVSYSQLFLLVTIPLTVAMQGLHWRFYWQRVWQGTTSNEVDLLHEAESAVAIKAEQWDDLVRKVSGTKQKMLHVKAPLQGLDFMEKVAAYPQTLRMSIQSSSGLLDGFSHLASVTDNDEVMSLPMVDCMGPGPLSKIAVVAMFSHICRALLLLWIWMAGRTPGLGEDYIEYHTYHHLGADVQDANTILLRNMTHSAGRPADLTATGVMQSLLQTYAADGGRILGRWWASLSWLYVHVLLVNGTLAVLMGAVCWQTGLFKALDALLHAGVLFVQADAQCRKIIICRDVIHLSLGAEISTLFTLVLPVLRYLRNANFLRNDLQLDMHKGMLHVLLSGSLGCMLPGSAHVLAVSGANIQDSMQYDSVLWDRAIMSSLLSASVSCFALFVACHDRRMDIIVFVFQLFVVQLKGAVDARTLRLMRIGAIVDELSWWKNQKEVKASLVKDFHQDEKPTIEWKIEWKRRLGVTQDGPPRASRSKTKSKVLHAPLANSPRLPQQDAEQAGPRPWWDCCECTGEEREGHPEWESCWRVEARMHRLLNEKLNEKLGRFDDYLCFDVIVHKRIWCLWTLEVVYRFSLSGDDSGGEREFVGKQVFSGESSGDAHPSSVSLVLPGEERRWGRPYWRGNLLAVAPDNELLSQVRLKVKRESNVKLEVSQVRLNVHACTMRPETPTRGEWFKQMTPSCLKTEACTMEGDAEYQLMGQRERKEPGWDKMSPLELHARLWPHVQESNESSCSDGSALGQAPGPVDVTIDTKFDLSACLYQSDGANANPCSSGSSSLVTSDREDSAERLPPTEGPERGAGQEPLLSP
ncbi:unnamed protein product [Prorocentrum cordatum]|uniref:Uncharacterized protein n=1 Tax=Prorocentrum cordatum TaxID=2364126 RepID=A0ABN9SMM4_9DINO|nr:unnamed protein product [Polarella glacialis]